MATTYVEETILRVRDRASPEIRKVRNELRRLYDEAERLNRSRGFRFDFAGIGEARAELQRLRSDLRSLRGATSHRVTITGGARAEVRAIASDLASLQSRSARLDVLGLSAATGGVSRLQGMLNRLDGRSYSARVDVTGDAAAQASWIAAELRSIPQRTTAHIALTTDANEDVSRLITSLRELPERTTARVNTPGLQSAVRNAERLKAVLNELNGQQVGISISAANLTQIVAEVRALRDLVNRLDGSTIDLNVNDGGGTGGGRRAATSFPGGRIGREFSERGRDAATEGVIEGVRRGVEQSDIGETRLQLQDLPVEVQVDLREIATTARVGTSFTEGEALSLVVESFNSSQGDLDQLNTLIENAMRFARLQISLGEDRQTAIDSASQLVLVGERTGTFTNADGTFDPVATQQFFDMFTQGSIVFGREINVALGAELQRNLRSTGLSLSDTGRLIALAFAEEMRANAGVGMNMAVQNLSGLSSSAARRANLQDMGLITLEEVEVGGVGGEPIRLEIRPTVVNEDLLRSNPFQWIAENLIPAMQARGLDPNNPVDAAAMAGLVAGERTAQDFITSAIVRSQEVANIVERAENLDVSTGRMDQVFDQSLLVQLADTTAALTNLFGELANSLEGAVIPALNAVENGANFLSGFIGDSPAAGTAVAAGAAVGGLATVGLVSRMVLSLVGLGPAAASAATGVTALVAGLLSLSRIPIVAGAAWFVSSNAGSSAPMSRLDEQQRVDLANLTPAARDDFMSIMREASEAQRTGNDQAEAEAMTRAFAFLASQPTSGASVALPEVRDALADLSEAQAALANAVQTAEDRSRAMGMPGQVGAASQQEIATATENLIAAQATVLELLGDLPPEVMAAMETDLSSELAMALSSVIGPSAVAEAMAPAFDGLATALPNLGEGADRMSAALEQGSAAQDAAASALSGAGSELTGAASALMTAAQSLSNVQVQVNQTGAPSTRTPAPRLDTGSTGPQ